MATATNEQSDAATLEPNSRKWRRPSLADARHEHIFFSGMAILILGTVALGFGRTYYLAGLFRAPLPSWVIHVHGAVFSAWILLLIVQTSFVSVGRIHETAMAVVSFWLRNTGCNCDARRSNCA
jgi:hypothetical protein